MCPLWAPVLADPRSSPPQVFARSPPAGVWGLVLLVFWLRALALGPGDSAGPLSGCTFLNRGPPCHHDPCPSFVFKPRVLCQAPAGTESASPLTGDPAVGGCPWTQQTLLSAGHPAPSSRLARPAGGSLAPSAGHSQDFLLGLAR